MAERTFAVEFRGVTFDVTAEYHPDDPENWWALKAVPQDTDTDWLFFLMADNHTNAEWDRLCDQNMREFAATGVDDVMDAVHAEIDEKLRSEK